MNKAAKVMPSAVVMQPQLGNPVLDPRGGLQGNLAPKPEPQVNFYAGNLYAECNTTILLF